MIETPRLSLVPIVRGGFTDLHGVLEDARDVIEMRREQIAADAASEPWLLRALVLDGVAIGTVGFHAPPDARHCVEIGYEVAKPFRRRGYAREAAIALMMWAAARGVRVIRAAVAPNNAASLAMVQSLGFVHVGEQLDEVDGRELLFERPAELP